MLDPKLSLRSVYMYKKTDLRYKQSGVHRIDYEDVYEGIRSRYPIKQSHDVRMKPFRYLWNPVLADWRSQQSTTVTNISAKKPRQ